jgi:ribosomal protein S18 acetylase RimI-like enzyme
MIRKAAIHDIETIVSFNANLAKETEGLELNKERLRTGVEAIVLDSSKGNYFVYEHNGEVIGQMMITLEWSDWRNGHFWWIQSVYVHQAFRRKGIFQALYNHVKDLVSNDPSVCGLRLYVEKENTTAQATYQKLGMEETYYLLYEWEK